MFLQKMKEREILTSIEITQCWKWSPVKWGGAPGEHGENSNEHRHQPLANHDPNNHANLVPKLPPPSCKNESKAHQAPRFPASQTTNPPEQTTIGRYATKRTWESLHPKPPIHQKQTMLACRACNITNHPPPTKCIVGELPLRDVYLSRERYVAPQRHVAARASDLARENGRMTAPGTRTSRAPPPVPWRAEHDCALSPMR
jgi:hypothetical protein